MPNGSVQIVLGCFGRIDDGFVSCSGVQNCILNLGPKDPDYSKIMNYLDNLQLFDRRLLDYNAVRHFVFNLQNKYSYVTHSLWSEKMFKLYQKFTIDHRDCGIFVDLSV